MKESVLKLGDDINTDDIIPAARCVSSDPDYLKHYVLEHLIGENVVMNYDVIEAGRNFGCGSSREVAPMAIKAAGINLVRAHSFAEIFYRNSVNIGLRLEVTREESVHPIVEGIVQAGGLSRFNLERKEVGRKATAATALPRPMTVTEKILARASGNRFVQPGDVVFANVDLAMAHDATANPVQGIFYQAFGSEAQIWNKDRFVLVADHFIQVNDIRVDPGVPELLKGLRAFAKRTECHLLDVVSPGNAAGICHVLLPERGFVRPGMVIAGTDSHSCTYGAFGCFSTGVGSTDMANILYRGDFWLRVPGTLLFNLTGQLRQHLSAKDVMLYILGQIGCDGASGRVMEFRGSIVESMDMDERMTLANMAVECGAVCGVIQADDVTREYLRNRTDGAFEPVLGDDDAIYERTYQFDLNELRSQVASPSKPDQVATSIEDLGDVRIDKAFIGSCTGGKLHDLAEAATAIRGAKIAPGVELFVVPASQEIRTQAESLGYLKILEQAGATILPTGCGACINSGRGVLGKNEVGVYATNRNFNGRSGDPSGRNYLASPRVVAISAVIGKIGDRLEPSI